MQKKKEEKKVVADDSGAGGLKKQTRLGLESKKDENLAEWYSQVNSFVRFDFLTSNIYKRLDAWIIFPLIF